MSLDRVLLAKGQRDLRPGRFRRLAGAHFIVLASIMPGSPTFAQDCYSHTLDQEQDAILDWIVQHYDWGGAVILPLNDEDLYEADIAVYPDGYCRVHVMVDDECGVSVVEVVEGDAC